MLNKKSIRILYSIYFSLNVFACGSTGNKPVHENIKTLTLPISQSPFPWLIPHNQILAATLQSQSTFYYQNIQKDVILHTKCHTFPKSDVNLKGPISDKQLYELPMGLYRFFDASREPLSREWDSENWCLLSAHKISQQIWVLEFETSPGLRFIQTVLLYR